MRIRQINTTSRPISILLVSSTDHINGVTGLSPTVSLSKDGGAFALASGAVTEIGLGLYKLAGNATDRNTLGELNIHASGAGADPFDVTYTIVSWNPFDVASDILTNTSNKIAVDTDNAIKLPITPPSGYGTENIVSDIISGIGSTPPFENLQDDELHTAKP